MKSPATVTAVCRAGNESVFYSRGLRAVPRRRRSSRRQRRTGGPGRCRGRFCTRSASAQIRTQAVSTVGSTSARELAPASSRRPAASSRSPEPCQRAGGRSRSRRLTATPSRCCISAPWPSGEERPSPRARRLVRWARAGCPSSPSRTCTSASARPPTPRATSTRSSSCRRSPSRLRRASRRRRIRCRGRSLRLRLLRHRSRSRRRPTPRRLRNRDTRPRGQGLAHRRGRGLSHPSPRRGGGSMSSLGRTRRRLPRSPVLRNARRPRGPSGLSPRARRAKLGPRRNAQCAPHLLSFPTRSRCRLARIGSR